jgi:site-specific DNA recombinase
VVANAATKGPVAASGKKNRAPRFSKILQRVSPYLSSKKLAKRKREPILKARHHAVGVCALFTVNSAVPPLTKKGQNVPNDHFAVNSCIFSIDTVDGNVYHRCMSKAVGYVRVSTDGQAEEGVSLEAQSVKIKACAAMHDLDLVCVIEDAGVSGSSLKRNGLSRVLAMLDSGEIDTVIIAKLDRLSRSVTDTLGLIQRYFSDGNRQLISVADSLDTKTANGRMIITILTTLAQWERETIAERTKDALQHKRSKGEYTGGQAPYGFERGDDGLLIKSEEEQKVIASVRRYRASGVSYRSACERLAARGILSRKNTAFNPSQLHRMINRKRVA